MRTSTKSALLDRNSQQLTTSPKPTQALEAYGKSHELTTDDGKVGKDYRLAIADVTRCMTREQLADFVVSTLDKYEVSAAE